MPRESYIIIAPDGRECHWTRAPYPARAIFKLLHGRIDLWPYAQEQGYSCRTALPLDITRPAADFSYLQLRITAGTP